MQQPVLDRTIEKLAQAAEQAGLSIEDLIRILNAGVSVERLLDLIGRGLQASQDEDWSYSRWVM
ncbi:MAG TPA: hypothetical protein VNZ03_00835 [Terriglobales bacterium]|jgi:hypothetical protein|nr:hypothetical protein [Terriglobales bacterium]